MSAEHLIILRLSLATDLAPILFNLPLHFSESDELQNEDYALSNYLLASTCDRILGEETPTSSWCKL